MGEYPVEVVIFTLDGGSDPSCEGTGQCSKVIIEKRDPPPTAEKLGVVNRSDWFKNMLLPQRGTAYPNREKGFDCVSSTSFSSVFSSLSGCSGSPAGRSDKANAEKSPKPEPKPPEDRFNNPELLKDALLHARNDGKSWARDAVGGDENKCLFFKPVGAQADVLVLAIQKLEPRADGTVPYAFTIHINDAVEKVARPLFVGTKAGSSIKVINGDPLLPLSGPAASAASAASAIAAEFAGSDCK